MADRKTEINAMRRKGMTYDEIGKALGITRQRAYQIGSREEAHYFHAKTVAKIPYIGLRNWMMKNRVSISELSRRCGVKILVLDGRHTLRMATAEKILQVTGLTFEKCFRRDDNGIAKD